ncbi:MAG: hypothetical protein ACI9TH_001734 [Kiritimatiellia bacterium]|jgi:hypothetical protein
MSAVPPSRTSSKKVVFNLVILLFLAGFAELGTYLIFKRMAWRFTFNDPKVHVKTQTEIDSVRPLFDPDLGFDRLPNGRTLVHDYGTSRITTYGDSYTEGDEVQDHETWQTYLSSNLQANVLNYGLNGYGTDQAYLRFKKYHPKLKTEVAVLCLITENINRCLNVYRPFYAATSGAYLPKPRFLLKDGGNVLLPNPLHSAAELDRLKDPSFFEEMGKHDRWYNIDGKPEFAFPYLRLWGSPYIWTVLKSQREGAELKQVNLRPWEVDTWKDSEAQAIMFNIFSDFVADAKAMGVTPVIAVIPMKKEVVAAAEGGVVEDIAIISKECEEKGYAFFNGLNAYLAAVKAGAPPESLYVLHHPSAEGNQAFARDFAAFLQPLLAP